MTNIAQTFAWKDIGEGLQDVLANRTNEFVYGGYAGDSEMELLLLVAGGLNDGEAKQALIIAVITAIAGIGKVQFILSSPEAVEVLWKYVVRPGDKQMFDIVTNNIQLNAPEKLGPFVEVYSRYSSNYDALGEQFVVLKAITAKRTAWLKTEIERLDKIEKEFSWKMPYAEPPSEDFENNEFQNFLRGPEQSTTFKGVKKYGGKLQEFTGLRDAKRFATKWVLEGPYESSFTAEASEDKAPIVTITKTRKWFDYSQTKLAQYKAELTRLNEIY